MKSSLYSYPRCELDLRLFLTALGGQVHTPIRPLLSVYSFSSRSGIRESAITTVLKSLQTARL